MSISAFTHVDSHDVLESRKVEQLEAQLLSMFSPPLRPEEVQRCLIDCVASYEPARVRSYLLILIERETTRRLQDLSSAAHDRHDRGVP